MADTIVTMTSPEGATLNTAGTYCEGNIEVVPKLQSKTATMGEIVTADDWYVGLSEVDTNPAFEAGKKSEYDAFWDSYLPSEMVVSPVGFFAGKAWKLSTFKPNKSIVVNDSCNYMFYNCGVRGDLVDIFENLGHSITFEQIASAVNMFNFSEFTRLPVLSFASGVVLNNTFGGCGYLVVIDGLSIDSTNTFLNTFNTCRSLKSLTIIGVIANNGLNFSWSPLSKASLTSIINALSSTTTGLTVTLRLAAVNTAFETTAGAADGSTSEEWTALIATKPNWTINLINS